MKSDLLKEFPIIIDIALAWGEMDSFKHVNNIIYLRYFESSRIRYFEESGLIEVLEKTGIGPILKETYCRFRLPLTYPDQVSVGVRISELKKDRFRQDYRMVSQKQDQIAAEGYGVIVAYDYRKNQKANFPVSLLKDIEKLENRSLLD